MTYIEGFVAAVPSANKDAFIRHAGNADPVWLEHGATRVVECWADDVPQGQTTDFFGAVNCKSDEAIVFSWIEWPDRAPRQAMADNMENLVNTDERLNPEKNPMPFDGMRMIYGGFVPIVEEGSPSAGSYVQGYIVPVPTDKRETYRDVALKVWPFYKEYGALRLVEAWQDDVPAGKQTDFFRAVKAEPGESIVFSFIEWPSRQICDEAAEKMQHDERMKPPADMEIPFDGKRLVYGGFKPVVELGE